jgi:4a-hydroxytetrahydrobiopterin dehydratase
MIDLTQVGCEVCMVGAPQVTQQEADEFMQQIPDWSIVEVDGERRLRRIFKFQDFAQALAFTDKVGALAEENGHHPKLETEWGNVTVWWWTHKINGLHLNDFAMAAQTDLLLPRMH